MCELIEYLAKHQDAAKVLPELLKVAVRELPDAEIVVDLYRDPEEDDEHVVVYVRFDNYDGDQLERIRKVRSLCRGMLKGKKAFVFLTTDFEPRGRG